MTSYVKGILSVGMTLTGVSLDNTFNNYLISLPKFNFIRLACKNTTYIIKDCFRSSNGFEGFYWFSKIKEQQQLWCWWFADPASQVHFTPNRPLSDLHF